MLIKDNNTNNLSILKFYVIEQWTFNSAAFFKLFLIQSYFFIVKQFLNFEEDIKEGLLM